MKQSTPGRALMLFFAAFLLLMVILPLLYPGGSFTGLDGRSGVIENWEKLRFADPLTRAVYTMGDLFCHQEEWRSFMINGSQMAFCQRDVSILAGVVLGLFVTDRTADRFYAGDKLFLILGAVMLVSTGIEWLIEHSFEVDLLAARAATGVLTGIGIALILQYVIAKDYELIVKLK